MLRKFLFVSFLSAALFVLAPDSLVEAKTLSGPSSAVNRMPDLIVKEIGDVPLRTRFLVRVVNQGNGPSSSCHLALMSGFGDDPAISTKKRVWTIEIPALPAGEEFSETINVWPMTRGQGPWKAVVDRSNVVKESNESNNQLAYSLPSQGVVDSNKPVVKANDTNKLTATKDASLKPAAGPLKPAKDNADLITKSPATVDLAAINVFDSIDGIRGVIRNLGSQTYIGKRQATITVSIVKKDGSKFQKTLGTKQVPIIGAGGQQSISFPTPPEFAQADEYRLTLTINGGDPDASNDTKVNATPGFSSGGNSAEADLQAAEVKTFSEAGVRKMRGVVRNISSQGYQGQREATLYFVDQTGGQKKVNVIAAAAIPNIAAGGEWEIVGEVPDNLKKVKTFTLKLFISGGDKNSANNSKTRNFVPIDDN